MMDLGNGNYLPLPHGGNNDEQFRFTGCLTRIANAGTTIGQTQTYAQTR